MTAITDKPPNRITIGGRLTVNRVGYGAMKLTGDHVWGEYPDREGGIAVLRGAVDAGINFIDTADVYGPHSNEILIRDALYPYPGRLVIATKGGFVRGGYSYDTLGAVGNVNYLRQSAHLSARRLGGDRPVLPAQRMRDRCAIRGPGGCARRAEAAGPDPRHRPVEHHRGQLRIAQGITDIAAVTALYNVTMRTGADLLDAAGQDGIAFSPWHPITTTDGPNADRAASILTPIAAAHRATVQQIALAWQLRRSPASLPIPGTTSVSHLKENLAAESIDLTDDEFASITSISPEA